MQTETEFLRIISISYSKAFDRIIHAVRQLNDQQMWYRPSINSNSIGIILQHLVGNLNQWICSGVGGETFHRNRAQEFEEGHNLSNEAVLTELGLLRVRIQDVISKVPSESLLSNRRIQGFDETVLSALLAALTHLELHGGQITFIVKLIVADKYEASWRPASAEQGMA